jgi:methionine aminopeptidase
MVATPPALDSNTLIPTSAELETLREAGRIASAARNWAAKTIKPGYLLRD